MCGESPESSLWLLGLLFSILSSTCTNLGVNLQKYSFLCEAKRTKKEKRSYVSQPKWVCGLLMVVAGGLLDFVALAYAPQSLVTPVGGFTIVANVVFAHYLLNEAFNRSDATATALIIGGVVQVALFADKSETCYTADELVSFYSRTAFIIYALVISLLIVVLLLLVRHVEKILESFGSNSSSYKKFRRIHSILYPALSGLFGAQSVLFAKSTVELIKTFNVTGVNQFTQFRTYFSACTMVLCIFLQIHWLAKGLEKFDAVFTVPIFQCFFITVSIVGGGVYFDEFRDMSSFQFSMFLLGVMLTLAGVFLMSKREMNEQTTNFNDTLSSSTDDDDDNSTEEVEYRQLSHLTDVDTHDKMVLMEPHRDQGKVTVIDSRMIIDRIESSSISPNEEIV